MHMAEKFHRGAEPGPSRQVLHGSIVFFDTCDYGFCQGHCCQGPREESRILLLSSVTVLQLSKNSKQITDAMRVFSAMVSAAWRAVALPSCHC